MDDIPPLTAGWIRLAVLLDRGPALTPGAIAISVGSAVDQLGHLVIGRDHALVDVRETALDEMLVALGTLGPVQIHSRYQDVITEWIWLRLAIGRNHSLTPATLKRIFTRAGCRQIGTYQIRNTCAFAGVPRREAARLVAELADTRVNGYALRPAIADGTDCPRQDPRFRGKM